LHHAIERDECRCNYFSHYQKYIKRLIFTTKYEVQFLLPGPTFNFRFSF
jgi:hypothetical protein